MATSDGNANVATGDGNDDVVTTNVVHVDVTDDSLTQVLSMRDPKHAKDILAKLVVDFVDDKDKQADKILLVGYRPGYK